MRFRRRGVPLFTLIFTLLPLGALPVGVPSIGALPIGVGPARAATTCRPVSGIGQEIAKFLDEVAVAQAAGRGSLPLMDALFGVTDINADDQKALDRRKLVELSPHGVTGGDFVNEGPEKITIEGIFAEQETYFRMPPLVKGRYTIDAPDGVNVRSVTLLYDPKHAVDLGEPHVGLRFFKPTHHTVITRDGVAFFLDDNTGPDPDRCYRATAE
jgi:hypothetical protein